ncbi:MAG TPA: cupin domain-containing protein [Candidatus Bathyarchaeota archaeon]|nr:cupin domain-containing protein [Candidatus Bathyarchaeota archaeon]
MNIFHYTTVTPKDAGPQTSKTNVRWLITKEMGAKNFAMRLFEIQPDGYTPLHTHDWEHEIFILEGEGILVSGEKEFSFKTGDVVFIPPNELHQMKNTGNKTCKIICLIPYKEN